MTDDPRRIEYMPLSEITGAIDNPKRHDLPTIARSIDEFGYVEPIVIDERTSRLVAGHGRTEDLQARRAAGAEPPDGVVVRGEEWMVPVVRGWASETDEQAAAYLLVSNRAPQLGGWDNAQLADMLRTLDDSDSSLLLAAGFDEDTLEDLLDAQTHPPFEVVRVSIDSLRDHPENYRAHPDDQLDEIEQSIKDHGFYRNVVVATDLTILAGHGVVAAARRMGRTRIPVVRLELAADDPKALKLLAADNEISHLAIIDDHALSSILSRVMSDDQLLGTGYDENMAAGLAYLIQPPGMSSDKAAMAAAEWIGLPDYEPRGDLNRAFELTFRFDSETDRAKFVEKYDLQEHLTIGKEGTRLWSARWPSVGRDDFKQVRFVEDG